MAGIVAGNVPEWAEEQFEMETMGIAPEAQLVVLKVFDAGGGARFSSIARALEDAILLGVDCANLSWAPMPVHTMMRELRNITKQPAMLASTS
ncbi:MAG: S8 family serine peptidase [Oscillospiraceae bacterium]